MLLEMTIRIPQTLAIAAILTLASFLSTPRSVAADRTIGVFVALADNQNQGILPVPKALGNGDDPDKNLYWGAGEGLKTWFDRSKKWKLLTKDDSPLDLQVLRAQTYRHTRTSATLTAFAYRGAAIENCIRDFESAVRQGSYDLVVYIGHNGLMDFDLALPAKSNKQARTPDCIVLCCKSREYFESRLKAAGGHPILLTTQFMYPGSFILAAVADSWLAGSNLAAIRQNAAAAYAANQNISQKSATGVFANLKD